MAEDGFEITNLDAVLAGIMREAKALENAAVYGVRAVALTLEREVKTLLTNNQHQRKGNSWIPPGHIGGPGTPPNRRTGSLVRSVKTEERSGFGTYEATVFPSMIYARRLEQDWQYPYMEPSANKVRRDAQRIFTDAFNRKWAP